MIASNGPLDYSHEAPRAFPGVDDDVWEQSMRRFLAAMLVTAHRAGVHISHARIRDLGSTLRTILRTDPLTEPVLACMLAAGQHAHLDHLRTHGTAASALDNAGELVRRDLERVTSRYRLDMDTARREAAPIVRDNSDLIGRVVARLVDAHLLTGLHLAALADPTRPDPSPGAPVLARADRDWLAPHADITVLAVLPSLEGGLAQMAEGLLPALAAHADLVSAVPVHQLHWPLCWGTDLSDAATGRLVDAVTSAAHTVGPVSAVGLLHLIPVHHPMEVGLYLDEHADGMDRLVDLAMGASSTVERDLRSRISLTSIAHLTVARCHTPGVADGLMEAVGAVAATVELRSLAVLRMRFDDRASLCRWQALAEAEL